MKSVFHDYGLKDSKDKSSSLSDIIRMAFYEEEPNLFGLVDYENDFTFLEPSLFCYFLSDISKTNKSPCFSLWLVIFLLKKD